ncbi:MAG: AraC family transcriptional regulator ligand-binding domain-containing protein [Pseudomonadota bacterium]|nr:AraC family transcriptional regulator ligand-binding domain-containing protein [Pseudomonadota bacterium]
MSDDYFFRLEGPLESTPVERQMRTANLNGFSGLVRTLGGDPREILERHGIDARLIHDPDAFIDSKALVDMLEFCSRSLREPLFGLRLAQLQDPIGVYGSVAALCKAAATMREAVTCFIDYIPVVHSPVPVLELVEGREAAEIRWRVQADLGRNTQASLQAAMLNLKLLRLVGGPGFQPSRVQLTVDVPADVVPEIESRLGCPFRAGASVNAVRFPAAFLNQPVSSANRLLFRLLGGYLDRVRAASRRTIVERVEDYLRGALPRGSCSVEQCARKLGTSVRTLQASLSEHGLRFSDILEKMRIDLAKDHLEHGQMSLDALADLLGYSDQSSFGRAFKRWTGMPPQRFRRELASGAARGQAKIPQTGRHTPPPAAARLGA